MTCPNLERFSGFIPFYNHTFDRLTHALSTRTKLRQHVWVIAENDDVRERSQKQLPPGLLDEAQTFQFMLYHQRWKHLETLMLCSPGGLGVIEHSLFQNILHSLPSLRDLGISSFDADDFHDKTLLSIPRVASLRLEECLGVTEAGLTRWAARPRAAAVERLSLIHQNVTSLLTLSKILASLDSLWKFTILQTDVIPTLSVDPGTVVIQPVLASQTLKFLHWDVLCNHQNVHPDAEPNANSRTQSDFNRAREDVGPTANEHLAMSISHNGFPALTHLRVPRDTAPGGALQSVCLPLRDKCTLPENTETPPTSKEGLHSNSLRAARLRALQFAQDRENVSKPPAAEAFELSAESDKVVNYPTDSEASVSTLNTLRSFLTHSSTNTTATNQSHIRSPVSPLDAEQQWMYQIPNPSPNNELLNRRQQDTRASDSAAKRDSICQCEPDAESICTCDGPANSGLDRQRPPTPPRSPLRNSSRLSQSGPFPWDDLNTPYQYQKGETPRQSSSSTSSGTSLPTIQRYKRPIFCLEPDVPGHDANGGLVGWAELLRIREKARMAAGGRGSGHEQEDDDDGDLQERTCTGSWNARFETSDEKRRDWSELELDLVQELTNSNSSSYTLESARSESGTKWRSRLKGKSPSTSRLSLPLRSKAAAGVPLRKTEDKGRHVARPRGERGGCVRVDDFF